MEVNTVARSLIVIVHTMGFVERRQFLEHHKKMACQKDEQNDHGVCKVYENACRVALTVLGRCCKHCCLFNKQRAFKRFEWWDSRGRIDR